MCVGVCAIIVLTAFGQFSAAFLGGQRELRRCAMTAVDAAAMRLNSTLAVVVVVAAVVVALSAPASTPI